MVQEFYVLKCHSCELHQVHIVKKAKKWNCKVCGVKQSVVKVFGQGSAKDCRIHVQKLNGQLCQNTQNPNENVEESANNLDLENAVNTYNDHSSRDANENCNSEVRRRKLSNNKWQKYLESDETSEISDDSSKFDPSHSPSNFAQRSEPDERVFKKPRLSRDYTEMKKNPNENINKENANLNSNKMFQFLSDDELSSIDDILEV